MGSECRPSKKINQNLVIQLFTQELKDKYIFSNVIGYGSYSCVKLAINKKDNLLYAAKIIDKTLILKYNLFNDIFREKEILLKLTKLNKNLNSKFYKLIQCLQDSEKLYFIIQFMKFGNLRSLIQNRAQTLDQEKAKYICIKILQGLQELQKLKIIHGDIKPQNILIDQKGSFKICDFSSAHYYGCSVNEIKGTRGYIAPEIMENLNKKQKYFLTNNKSDLYSLGTVLWEILHGQKYNRSFIRSFYSSKKCSRQLQITHDSDSLNNSEIQLNLTPQCQNFLEILLKKNPEQRPNIMYLRTHPWLYKERMLMKQQGEIQIQNPFNKIKNYFNYLEKQKISYRRSKDYQDDDFIMGIKLNKKKVQDLFLPFNSSQLNRKRHLSKRLF